MADKTTSPYHLGEQQGIALVRPAAAELAELSTRLGHYVGRIPMSDADRAIVREAETIVATARDGVARLVAALESRDQQR